MQRPSTNHYAILGLDRNCTLTQIRSAYRILARQHHPDLNPDSPAAVRRTQELNAAYETLSDTGKRAEHDLELDAPKTSATGNRSGAVKRNVSQDVNLRFEELFRGTTREVRVYDPSSPSGPETYELTVPPATAPGTRFRLPRHEPFTGGFVQIRVKAQPTAQFKVRGCDVRCDLKIKPERATQGGVEMVRGINGTMVQVPIPKGVGRNEIIRVSGGGLPKPRGGRGDLLVRITYRVEVKFSRAGRR